MDLKILYFAILFQTTFEVCYATLKMPLFSKKVPINITEAYDIVSKPHDGPIQYAPVAVKLNSMEKVEKHGIIMSTTTPLMNYNINLNLVSFKTESPMEDKLAKRLEAPLTQRVQQPVTPQLEDIDNTVIKHFPRIKSLPKVKNKRVKEIEEPKMKTNNQEITRSLLYNRNEDLNNELIMSVENGQHVLKPAIRLNVGRSYNIMMPYKPKAIFDDVLENQKFIHM